MTRGVWEDSDVVIGPLACEAAQRALRTESDGIGTTARIALMPAPVFPGTLHGDAVRLLKTFQEGWK